MDKKELRKLMINKRNNMNKIEKIRKDNIINLCEIKFYSDDYTVSKEYYRRLLQRIKNIQPLVNKKCAVRNTLITTFGLKKNEYSSAFSDVIVLDDLFSL